jgi:hypothetical protein
MAKRSRVQTNNQPCPNSVQDGLNSTIGTTTGMLAMSLPKLNFTNSIFYVLLKNLENKRECIYVCIT